MKLLKTINMRRRKRRRRREANWIGHNLLRNCYVKDVIEGKIKWTGRRGRSINSYWMTLRKREALGRCLWKTPVGRAYGLVIRKDTLLLLLLLLLETCLCVTQLGLDGTAVDRISP